MLSSENKENVPEPSTSNPVLKEGVSSSNASPLQTAGQLFILSIPLVLRKRSLLLKEE